MWFCNAAHIYKIKVHGVMMCGTGIWGAVYRCELSWLHVSVVMGYVYVAGPTSFPIHSDRQSFVHKSENIFISWSQNINNPFWETWKY